MSEPEESSLGKRSAGVAFEEAQSPGAAAAAAAAAAAEGGSGAVSQQSQPQPQPQGGSSQPAYATRARLEAKTKGESKELDRSANIKQGKDRWRTHRVTEDYVNFVGDIMYPKTVYAAYGYDATKGRFPFERITTLGYLLNPMRRPIVVEKWSPFEVAVFEASMTLFGKNFHQVAKMVKTKTTKEVIEFYYFWKKTNHYKQVSLLFPRSSLHRVFSTHYSPVPFSPLPHPAVQEDLHV